MALAVAEDDHLAEGRCRRDRGPAQRAERPAQGARALMRLRHLAGWDVARAVEASHPSLPVGFITGWGEDPKVIGVAGTAREVRCLPPLRTGTDRARGSLTNPGHVLLAVETATSYSREVSSGGAQFLRQRGALLVNRSGTKALITNMPRRIYIGRRATDRAQRRSGVSNAHDGGDRWKDRGSQRRVRLARGIIRGRGKWLSKREFEATRGKLEQLFRPSMTVVELRRVK